MDKATVELVKRGRELGSLIANRLPAIKDDEAQGIIRRRLCEVRGLLEYRAVHNMHAIAGAVRELETIALTVVQYQHDLDES
jgi:hypothetical protein